MSNKILYFSFLLLSDQLISIKVATYHCIVTNSQFRRFISLYFLIWWKLLSFLLCKGLFHFSPSQVTSMNDLRITIAFQPVATMLVCSQLHCYVKKQFLKLSLIL